jgi:hypothetical protein
MNMYGAVTRNNEAPNYLRCGKIILKILSKFEHTQKKGKASKQQNIPSSTLDSFTQPL